MAPGGKAEHNLLVGEDGGDGVDTTRKGLAEDEDVRLDTWQGQDCREEIASEMERRK